MTEKEFSDIENRVKSGTPFRVLLDRQELFEYVLFLREALWRTELAAKSGLAMYPAAEKDLENR